MSTIVVIMIEATPFGLGRVMVMICLVFVGIFYPL